MNRDEATAFIRDVELPPLDRDVMETTPTEAGAVFDEAKTQAQVVGSGVFSFAQGVDTFVREAISDSALLAQLVANKRADAETDPLGWFRVYADVLQNVGWTIQDSTWSDYSSNGTAAEVNEKIVEVMSVALGPSPTALAVVAATIKALKGMSAGTSWLTIFARESQKARIAKFQVGLVEKDEGGDVFVSLLACLVEAQSDITQVLFFKFRQAHANFRADGQKVSINRAALTDLAPTIRDKIRAHQVDFLSSIQDI